MTLALRQETRAGDPATDPHELAIRAAIAAGRHGRALELLRAAYGQRVHAFARRMLRDDAAAEDVVQDTLLRAFRCLPTLRDGTSLRAWLMKIAAHRALDELRHRRRRGLRLADGVELPDVADPRPLPAQLLAAREEAHVLAACVDRMPERLRASLALYFGQERTFAEVGATLGETGAATLVRVRRGLVRLRGQLRRRGVDRGALAG